MSTLEQMHEEFTGNCDHDSAIKIMDKYKYVDNSELEVRGYYFHNPKHTKK